jgi:hypothetical protein
MGRLDLSRADERVGTMGSAGGMGMVEEEEMRPQINFIVH